MNTVKEHQKQRNYTALKYKRLSFNHFPLLRNPLVTFCDQNFIKIQGYNINFWVGAYPLRISPRRVLKGEFSLFSPSSLFSSHIHLLFPHSQPLLLNQRLSSLFFKQGRIRKSPPPPWGEGSRLSSLLGKNIKL